MSDKPEGGIKEMAGGWITERTGTRVPLFLKLTYVGFCLFGFVYLFLYSSGETGHATRGTLVEQFNKSIDLPGSAWIGFLAVLLLGFAAWLFTTAFGGHAGDDGE